MFFKFIKISLLITTCIFLSGFIQVAALIGPGVTIFSSGNVYRAGAQLLIDSEIKKKTGKNSLALITEEVTKQNDKKDFQEEFSQLVEKRFIITQKKLAEQNNQKKANEEFRKLIKKRVSLVRKELNLIKISQ
tara:strand:+ start:2077 stop:2475 length:399 start_codon:yes stop_codon:yes gene_type:complete